MPRASAIGSAPAAIIFSPSRKMASASTVAVVVPSPATSLVLLAASLTSWAPRFSNGSSRSMSSATVTPSFVTFGEPQPLSSTALRPRGPSVLFTARASLETPASSGWRASSSNTICLATKNSSIDVTEDVTEIQQINVLFGSPCLGCGKGSNRCAKETFLRTASFSARFQALVRKLLGLFLIQNRPLNTVPFWQGLYCRLEMLPPRRTWVPSPSS